MRIRNHEPPVFSRYSAGTACAAHLPASGIVPPLAALCHREVAWGKGHRPRA
ncbi:hypothetical protein [Acetobacter peroxydans]|uniref:hypothetical protein n=1 Tax=Acetobacter peroxydans TaxID=104098 RepID=UPI0022307BAF|nr:hypothetical protein [Acetobacter peroxydans]